jgi:DNA-binding SARP family transcriptional activator
MAKNPAATDQRLRRIAVELLNETGDRPDVEDVLARYEQVRRAELEELGVDPKSIFTTTTPPKTNSQAAEKKNSAKTLSNDLSTPTVPRPRSSEREQRAETLAMLESGRLEL